MGQTRHAQVITLTTDDIIDISNGDIKETYDGKIAIQSRELETSADSFSSQVELIIAISETVRNQLLPKGSYESIDEEVDTHSRPVTYGVRNPGHGLCEIYVRHGHVSDDLGTDKSVRDRLVDSGMTQREAERYAPDQ